MHVDYRCPICRGLLKLENKSWSCEKRHSFDQAREGYVNLLPVNKKQSRDPGDNAEMMAARRRFLNLGYYQPLLSQMADMIQDLDGYWLDIGCGEGWYTQGLQSASHHFDGIDISRSAVRMAAKSYPDCRFAVASSYDLPFIDQSFVGLVNVFAPLEANEACRVLQPKGFLLRLSPGPEHLYSLKKMLYDKPHLHTAEETMIEGFELLQTNRVQAEFILTKTETDTLRDLILMTPYAWKLQTINIEALTQALPAAIGLDVYVNLYQKA